MVHARQKALNLVQDLLRNEPRREKLWNVSSLIVASQGLLYHSSARSGMTSIERASEMRLADSRVDLRRVEANMPHKLLHCSNISAVVQ